MTEPTNPLFEDEKDFLERKKLEYERALRGDVAEIKETTVQAGKVALIGAGVVGGIWLLTKAFGGKSKSKKKHKHKKHRPEFEDYAGFDGFDENDQELSELATDFQAPDYAYDSHHGQDLDDGFYSTGSATTTGSDDDDDNGFGDNPDFPQHSFPHHETDVNHLAEDHGAEDEHDTTASSSSYQARPYDDSRRMPASNSFTEPAKQTPQAEKEKTSAKSSPGILLPAIVSFAKSETGRVIVAQAATVAFALASKVFHGIASGDKAETDKNADLAASSASAGIPPATWPATSAAQDASAAAHHDDNAATH